MDIHPSKEMVASAQKAGRTRKTQAHIRIWSPETLYTLYIVGNGEFEEGVSALAFSQLVRFMRFSIFLFEKKYTAHHTSVLKRKHNLHLYFVDRWKLFIGRRLRQRKNVVCLAMAVGPFVGKSGRE